MTKKMVKRTDANNETLYFYTHSDVVDVGEGNNTTSLTTALNNKADASDLQSLSNTVNTKASASDLQALSNVVATKASTSDLNSLNNVVLKKTEQALTQAEKNQVHNNLDSDDFLDERAVRYDEYQVLGSDEKELALVNLGLNGVDAEPTKNSQKMVRSGGVAGAIDNVQYARFDGIQETSVTLNTTTTATADGTVLFYVSNNVFIYKVGSTYYTLWNNTNRLTNGFYNDSESTSHALTTKIFINTGDGLPYSFDGTDFTTVAIDDEPIPNSDNLVKSGGVASVIQSITGTPKTDYEWQQTNGYYPVNLNTQIGSELPSVTIAANNGCTAKIPCKQGDKFVIHSRLALACAYFFLDADNKILFIPTDSLGTKYKDANHNTEIIAPVNSAFVIVQSNLIEWKSSEFGGDGTTGIYPYREATSGVVGQVEQNTSDIESINTQLGDHSGGMIKDIDDLQTSDELQNTKIDDLEGSLEDVSERIDEVVPKNYDKSKSYFKMELSAGSNNIRTFWNATNIKNEAPGTCFVDWGDGTPVVAIVNDDSLKHNYAEAGTYEICISGLTGLTSNQLLRGYSVLRDAKFGNTFTNTGTYYMLNDTSGLDSVEFFATTPLSWGTTSPNNMNNVNKIIVPNESLMKYLSSWYFSSITQNKDALTKKIVPKEPVGYIYNDKVVTVGTGGDFTSINDAIQNLSQSYPLYKKGGIKAVVKILSGTIINEQVYVDGLDLSWITIEYESYNPETLNYDNVAQSIANGTIIFDTTEGYNSVSVDATNFSNTSHDQRGDYTLFRAENGARLPIIGCVFKLTTPHATTGIAGIVCNRGSEAVVKTLCGFIGFQDGVISNNESSITIREGITMNCSRWGCHARHNGEVSARSVIATGCATNTTYASEYGAAVADRVADMDVREAYLSGNRAIRSSNASRICARGTHILGGGVSGTYLVYAEYNGVINGSGIEFSGVSGEGYDVSSGGIMDAFSPIGNPSFGKAKNTLSSHGVIFG